MKQIVYDIETYSNCFILVLYNLKDNEFKHFIIHEDKHELDELVEYINNSALMTIGYNNLEFDDIILNYILNNSSVSVENIYEFAQSLITYHKHKDKQSKEYKIIKDYKYTLFTCVDLMSLLYSSSLRVGLKEIEVTMKWYNVQDNPFNHYDKLNKEQLQIALEYCYNDVKATKALFDKVKTKLALRKEIKQNHKINNIYCLDDVNLGMNLLLDIYCKKYNTTKQEIQSRVTYPKEIAIRDVISNKIKFNSSKLQQLVEDYSKFVVYLNKNNDFKYTLHYADVAFSCGVGGIHTIDDSRVIVPNTDEVLIDIDVASLYPSLIINTGLDLPQAPGLIPLYKEIRDMRVIAKKEKQTLIAETYKLVLNGFYGNLKQIFSWAYYPKGTYQVTINGQLFILMLVEQLYENSCKIVSANTDGITFIVKKDNLAHIRNICKQWESYTELELEEVEYTKLVRKDINNYLAITSNGKIKTKGIFDTSVALGKSYDKPIVMKAVIEYFLSNTPIEKTIKNHNEILDFCMYKKIGKKFKVIWNGNEQQRINRYYASTSGAYLYKVDDNTNKKKISHVLKDTGVSLVNNITELDTKKYKDLNYKYYIYNANKIINSIKMYETQFKLF